MDCFLHHLLALIRRLKSKPAFVTTAGLCVSVQTMADWASLPKDILFLIIAKLTHLPDHCSLAAVCASWRASVIEYRALYPKPFAPGLLLPGINCDSSCKTRRFLANPVGKHVNQGYQLLLIPHEDLCRGSYEGWLVMVSKDMSIYLLNPFSQKRIHLPPVTAFRKPRPMDTRMSKWYVRKAILSSSPSSQDCLVMVIYGRGELGVCRPGDKAWCLMDWPQPWCEDGIFYKKNFYVVDGVGNVYICSLTGTELKMALFTPSAIGSPYHQRWYLVESKGQLLEIWRDRQLHGDLAYSDNEHESEDNEDNNQETNDEEDNDNSEEDSDSHDEDAKDSDDEYDDFDYDNIYDTSVRFLTTKTSGFEVYKLDISAPNPKWVDVKNLDGEAMFLGQNQSFVLSRPQLCGFKENRIYYTDDDLASHKLHIRSGNDIGVFSLEEPAANHPLYPADSESTKPPAVWFLPKPW